MVKDIRVCSMCGSECGDGSQHWGAGVSKRTKVESICGECIDKMPHGEFCDLCAGIRKCTRCGKKYQGDEGFCEECLIYSQNG